MDAQLAVVRWNRLFRSGWWLGFVSHYPNRPRHWIISTSVQSNGRELEFSNRLCDSSRFTTICCQVTGCFGLGDWVLSVITLIVRRLRGGRKGKTREREREREKDLKRVMREEEQGLRETEGNPSFVTHSL
jgi:hypothetical protein